MRFPFTDARALGGNFVTEDCLSFFGVDDVEEQRLEKEGVSNWLTFVTLTHPVSQLARARFGDAIPTLRTSVDNGVLPDDPPFCF